MPRPFFLLLSLLLAGILSVFLLKKEPTPNLLEGQVQYLQEQLHALEQENERLRQQVQSAQTSEPRETIWNAESALAVLNQLAQLRGLPGLEKTTVKQVSRQDLTQLIKQSLIAWFPVDYAQRQALAWQALHLIPRPLDFHQLKAAFYAQFLGVWYNNTTNEIWVDPTDPYCHLTTGYALSLLLKNKQTWIQDHFASPSCLDTSLAFESLLMGDAAVMSFQYEKNLPPSSHPLLPMDDPDHPIYQISVDAFTRSLWLFPFTTGQSFVQTLFYNGGFSRIDTEFYSHPPQQTDWIGNPLGYLQEAKNSPSTANLKIDLHTLPLTSSWKDQLGHYPIHLHLSSFLEDDIAAKLTRTIKKDTLWTGIAEAQLQDPVLWIIELYTPEDEKLWKLHLPKFLKSLFDVDPSATEQTKGKKSSFLPWYTIDTSNPNQVQILISTTEKEALTFKNALFSP
jgi:outer membrane murein-binding lipoprotein Lpp